ncbi:hypothetical protein Tco_1104027 [Tanacetum coccineum]
MRVQLWIQQRHELPCALRKFQGIGCAMIGGEVGSGGEYLKRRKMLMEEVSFVDGVLEGALGALGDEFGTLGDGVFMSSWVKSTNNYFCGMMLIFGLLETLEMEALMEAMNVHNEDFTSFDVSIKRGQETLSVMEELRLDLLSTFDSFDKRRVDKIALFIGLNRGLTKEIKNVSWKQLAFFDFKETIEGYVCEETLDVVGFVVDDQQHDLLECCVFTYGFVEFGNCGGKCRGFWVLLGCRIWYRQTPQPPRYSVDQHDREVIGNDNLDEDEEHFIGICLQNPQEHISYDVCFCESCLNEARILEEEPLNKVRRSNKPKRSRKRSSEKWSTLGEPSGKWDYYVRYDAPPDITPIEEVAATGWGDEFLDDEVTPGKVTILEEMSDWDDDERSEGKVLVIQERLAQNQQEFHIFRSLPMGFILLTSIASSSTNSSSSNGDVLGGGGISSIVV